MASAQRNYLRPECKHFRNLSHPRHMFNIASCYSQKDQHNGTVMYEMY